MLNQDFDREFVDAVGSFSTEMLKKLEAHKDKSGWGTMEPLPLLAKLTEEAGEVGKLLFNAFEGDSGSFGDLHEDELRELIAECADVANIAMMIADNAAATLMNREGSCSDM